MPKPTLANIAPEKRERVLREAARLFAERGYTQTDMAKLAKGIGVSKGSLYDYFDGKDDLFLSVGRHGLQHSRAAVYGEVEADWDIYRVVRHTFERGLAFARSHPEFVAIYLEVATAGMDRFAEELAQEVEKPTADLLKKKLSEGKEAGIVRADLDVNLAAFLINSVYVMFMVSQVSRLFSKRMDEYLELTEGDRDRALRRYAKRSVELIEGALRSAAGE